MINTILQIRFGDEYFGIDSDISNQILRVGVITSIPLSHPYLKGIVVLNGKIVPVVDLKQVLGLGEVDITKKESRIVTLNFENDEIAVLVDEVIDAINLDKNNYEENISQENDILGFYKYNNDLIQIIEIKNLIKDEMIEQFTPIEVESLNTKDKIIKNETSDTNRYLFFKVKDEIFGVDIELVAELIFVPKEIIHIAGSESQNLGAITLRDEVIDVFDFNLLFNFEAVDITNEKARILILKSENKKLALCVEDVLEIKDILLSNLENLSNALGDNKISSLYKDDENIVSIVSDSYFRGLIDEYSVTQTTHNNENIIGSSIKMVELAVFGISDEEFAFEIESVQEIITYQNITPLPESGEYIEGVINLRGGIIPVINLPKKLGFNSNITDKSKIIVCNIEGEKVGFLVDDVSDIMFVEDRFVATSKNSESLTKSTISLDNGKRVVLELRLNKIITKEELEKLKEE